MNRVNRKVQLIILLLLVSLVGTMSIAYAVLSTTLNITGTAQVQDASWNVHFDNVQVNPYSVEINPVITDNNKVSFSADLTTPGDFYKFTADIVNEGSIDAMIESIAKVPELTTEQKKYLRYEVEYVDGTSISDSQLLRSGETKSISVLFSYRNDIPPSDLPTTESDFDLEIALVYVQAASTGTEILGTDSKVKVVSGDLNTVGSEICIGEECFYLMKNDGHTVTMFAKYNLHVGNSVANSSYSVTPIEKSTGIQDSAALGSVWDESYNPINFPWIGTDVYSNSSYWWDSDMNSFKSDYLLDYIYCPYVYDSNSSIYNYVENYELYLESKGILVTESRLIKLSELVEFGCSTSDYRCTSAPSWIYKTSYWVGTAFKANLWYVYNNAHLGSYTYSYNFGLGVRPVIEIPLTEF